MVGLNFLRPRRDLNTFRPGYQIALAREHHGPQTGPAGLRFMTSIPIARLYILSPPAACTFALPLDGRPDLTKSLLTSLIWILFQLNT